MMHGLLSRIAGAALLFFFCGACAENGRNSSSIKLDEGHAPAESSEKAESPKSAEVLASLERIAEIERGGAFFPGLGLTESGLRERAGDFAGAAVAAYKELSWAYGYGSAPMAQVEEGLSNALALLGDVSPANESVRGFGAHALKGCIAFAGEEWERAEEYLSGISTEEEDPDSFLRWMLLVCALEKETGGGEARSGRSAYGAIRARYAFFPEYWYRGARFFSGREDGSISAAYAEQCINISPQGPFAAECRKILFSHAGLSAFNNAHSDIRTKAEIENVIRVSVSMNDPRVLEELFPLMALPDNPYTLYAQGALKALSAAAEFRSFFSEEARRASGRFGERMHYISRG